jgi:hypothetical protein
MLTRPPPALRIFTTGRTPRGQLPGKFIAAHFRPSRQVALLGDLVQLGAGLGRGAAGALAPGHGRALLAKRGPVFAGRCAIVFLPAAACWA